MMKLGVNKNMKKKISIGISNILLMLLLGTSFTFGQEKETSLKDKRITIKMDRQPFGKIIEYLIENYDVAVGFEESILDRDHNDYEFETNLSVGNQKRLISKDGNSRILITSEREFIVKKHWLSVNAVDSRLEDVLNNIVGQMQNYKWEINDDVVDIYPIKGRDEKFERILDLNIRHFELETKNSNPQIKKPIFLIRNQIFKLPELTSFLDENKFYYNKLYRESLDNLDRKIPNELSFSNLTFRELLNKITKIKRGGWILKRSDLYNTKEEESIDINI